MELDRTLAIRLTLATLSLGAAAVHFAMTPQHASESIVHGVGFVVAGWAQVVVAGLLFARPGRRTLAWAALVQLSLVAAWAVSRTYGLPVGPQPWTPEAVGAADLVTVAMEVGFVVLAVAALGSRRRVPIAAGLVAAGLIMGGTTAAIASPAVMAHNHRASEGAAGRAHVHTGAQTDAPTSGGTAGLDGAHAHAHIVTSSGPPTAGQIARANSLIEATKRAIPKWADPKAAEAAGFRAIQDPKSDFVHYVNFGWLVDDNILDPEAPESLVFRSTNGTVAGYRLESAMYILPSYGYPIPEVGGSLTPWHNHGDLCFGAGGMIVGTTAKGSCPTGSSNLKTPDMLHVWIVDHADGPFGGIEAVK
jgi:hypothetical protein